MPILTPAQERILRAARHSGVVRLNARSRKAVETLQKLSLVTFESKRVPGRTIKGRTEIVVRIAAAGQQFFQRVPVR
jgi:hypothetical protein